MPQIGEQVDFLRFLPASGMARLRHRLAVFLAGPGWVVVGVPKLLAGSFLAVLTLSTGVPAPLAADPAHMYLDRFRLHDPAADGRAAADGSLRRRLAAEDQRDECLCGFARLVELLLALTHSHPGRVVWLVFNVAIALLLMELGIYRLLEATLGIFSIIAMSWLATLSADLVVNKPLGLSPPGIEFKRAHLYDVNPVGSARCSFSASLALSAHFGLFGPCSPRSPPI